MTLMGSIKSETISGVKWTAIEKFSTQIVNFLLGLLLARLLSPSDFGTIGMLGIFMAISGTFIDSGFSGRTVKNHTRQNLRCGNTPCSSLRNALRMDKDLDGSGDKCDFDCIGHFVCRL